MSLTGNGKAQRPDASLPKSASGRLSGGAERHGGQADAPTATYGMVVESILVDIARARSGPPMTRTTCKIR